MVFYLERHKTLCFGPILLKKEGNNFLIFDQKSGKKGKNFQIFDQKSWTNPFKKCNIFDFLNRYFFSLKWLDFYLQGQKTLWDSFAEKQKGQNFHIFIKNRRQTPLEKCKIFDVFKSLFCSLKWLDFYLQGHLTVSFRLFRWKTKRTKFPIFHQKPWTNPFGKMQTFRLF